MKFLTFSKGRVLQKIDHILCTFLCYLVKGLLPTMILNAYHQSCRALYAMISVGEFM
jgi:hypothetical protein